MLNTPNIRFKGYSDDWEQRKLGECFDERTERSAEGELIAVTINSGVVKASELNRHDNSSEDKSNYKVVRVNDIAYNSMRMWQGASGYSQYDGILSPAYTVAIPREDINSVFFSYMFKRTDMIHEFQINSQGLTSDTWNLKFPAFSTIITKVPKPEEQQQIGSYFRNLDNLITLHQRKCDETKELKKYMLQKMFPKDGEKKPEIRFSGFADDWEQRKLGEVADKVTEKNSDLAVQETFTNSAEFGVISQRDFFDHDISNADNIGGYYVVRNEDFVYNPRISVTAPVGPVNRNKLGRNGVMSPLYTVFRTHDIDTTYLEWFFKSSYWHPFMFFNGDSGARSDRFSIKDAVFFEMPIPTPSLEEQRRIGAYLDKLDNLITLHQRKCDALKDIKKYMLQNMFPQKG